MKQRILFARVGWMPLYRGKDPGDLEPVGGGAYTASNRGHECFNFLPVDGRVLGYFQPQLQPRDAPRIHPLSVLKGLSRSVREIRFQMSWSSLSLVILPKEGNMSSGGIRMRRCIDLCRSQQQQPEKGSAIS